MGRGLDQRTLTQIARVEPYDSGNMTRLHFPPHSTAFPASTDTQSWPKGRVPRSGKYARHLGQRSPEPVHPKDLREKDVNHGLPKVLMLAAGLDKQLMIYYFCFRQVASMWLGPRRKNADALKVIQNVSTPRPRMINLSRSCKLRR